ncbi:MAG: hypothetical protein QXM02_05630 [Thermoproteota archaeon]
MGKLWKSRRRRTEEIIDLINEGKIDDAEALIDIGVSFWLKGAYEITLKIFDRATQLKPNYAEVRALREEVRTLQDLQTKREKWRKEGYNVSGLEKLKMKGVDHVRKVLDKFERIVQRISTLEREANVFSLKEIEVEVSSLKNRMGDLNRI